MCPNRFMPLYRLVKLYGQTGRDAEGRQLAGEIIVKPVKSAVVPGGPDETRNGKVFAKTLTFKSCAIHGCRYAQNVHDGLGDFENNLRTLATVRLIAYV